MKAAFITAPARLSFHTIPETKRNNIKMEKHLLSREPILRSFSELLEMKNISYDPGTLRYNAPDFLCCFLVYYI